MAINTTISVNSDTLLYIESLAIYFGRSKSFVIRKIILFLSNHQSSFIRDRFLTEYQISGENRCKRLHIYLSEIDLDIAHDQRRFFRASFSLLIAEVLEHFYNELFSMIQDTDNYTATSHCKVYYQSGNTICWKHFWGMVPEKELEPG